MTNIEDSVPSFYFKFPCFDANYLILRVLKNADISKFYARSEMQVVLLSKKYI